MGRGRGDVRVGSPGARIFQPTTREKPDRDARRILADQTGRVRASIGCVTARNGGFDRHRSQVPDDCARGLNPAAAPRCSSSPPRIGLATRGFSSRASETSRGKDAGGDAPERVRPATQELELIAQSDDPEILDMPDNICVAPWGDIYMSEDGKSDQYIRFLDADGQVQDFARNALSESELAGVCFSPDGKALFINIHKDHRTYMSR